MGAVTALVWLAILVGGITGYAGWARWIGPAIGAGAGALSLLPALSDPSVRIGEVFGGLVFNAGLFGAMPFGAYMLVSWLIG